MCVYSLCGIMVVVFFVFACYAQFLCGDVMTGDAISDDANFWTVPNSMVVLFQICTGMSMTGINNDCRQVHGWPIMVFFAAFFFVTNLLLVNLFIALLLDK